MIEALEILAGFFEILTDLGASVMLPIVIFILGIIFGQKIGKAFHSGLLIGVGFVGINLILDLLVGNLGPAAEAMVERFGIELGIIDVGWPASAAIAFGSQVGALIIPVALGVNIIMILFKLTKTVNVDIWNFWHFAFTGALVARLTDSLVWGLIAAAVNAAVVLVLADWTAPMVQDFYDLPNISLPHGFSAAFVPIAIPLNNLIDKIPGLKEIDADPETIQNKFGIFGQPVILGLILGLVLGVLAGYGAQEVLNLGVTMAAVMLLFPRMVKILMEGLTPLSEAAKKFMKEKFEEREIYIGLDSAIAIGHASAISTALVLVPITILLAVILPGNSVLPFGDLASLPFLVVMIIPITKGNIFRSTLIGTIVIAVGLYISTALAELHTAAAQAANFEFPEGAAMISSLIDGANPLTWILVRATGLGAWAIGLLGVLTLVAGYYVFKNYSARDDLA
ncbi:PTS galactitol transporter subunit IIC [Halanaerobium hydrogeniformans]|uniref:PTS system Galactitol-specific IIC component n=1 Tax=Halanaerobium hydrogeniformans TaxID=656519 RepID=E4RNF9_HALHG|nr:galactitol-specific PTS transporter subunit IIC [Halanaerobium hydrogeniformans]ADQ13627.1 PTS system Galactitol-specific IIC component [Halanaerobium hydrogeniformans]